MVIIMKKINFNSDWQFRKNEGSPWVPVQLPHDWLIDDVNNLYESNIATYRKTLDPSIPDGLREGQSIILRFDGVYMDSSLYVNESLVGEWKYGYTAFEYDITSFINKDGKNEITVKVNYQSPNSRWYSGAGIYRDCWLYIKNPAHFINDGIYISPKKEDSDNWKVTITAEVSSQAQNCQIRHSIIGTEHEITLPAASPEAILTVKNPLLWDTESPNCYTLRSELLLNGEVQDSIDTRFGFREIAYTPNGGFFLNGRRVKFFGCCQHHDLGALGAAFNKDAARRQLQILKDMGTNAIRTAHNPPAEAFMELADEMGILIQSEYTDMWRRGKTRFDYGRFFDEWSERDVASWVRRDRNCPSVIMWSVGNEIYDTHGDAVEGGKTLTYLMDLVKKHDPAGHAPLTFCTNYMPWENTQTCADIVKLIGYNYADYLYKDHHEAHPDWIIYGGETCSVVQSRGIYHFPLSKALLADDDLQCSSLGNSATSWGAKSTEACIIADRDAEFSLGQFLWTGTDYIGEPTPYHTKNSYFGQIDTAGFPKDSFYIFQSAWTDYKNKPMIHLFPYWDFSPGQNVDVRIASNAPKVELFINGRSLGTEHIDQKKGTSLIANYIVPYEKGTLKAVAYDEQGKIIAESSRSSFGDTALLAYKNETYGELVFTEIYALDKEGNPVENACDRVKVLVKGGTLLGLDNGDSTDYDQYKTDCRRLFSGKLLAIVKKDSEAEPEITAVIDSNDIPVRKIELIPEGFNVRAKIYPENATYNDLQWRLADPAGIDSPIGSITIAADGKSAKINPKGDGEAYIRCAVNNGKEHISLISLYPFTFEGYGKPFLDPYGFVSGGLYNLSNLPMTNGNDRGVATLRDRESHVGFADLDFGSYGSDEITLWLFPLSGAPFPFDVYEGMPEDGGEKICTLSYDKGSKWNTYIEVTYKLPRKLKGITTLSFVFNLKVHIKGFQFTSYNKAFQELNFADNDQIYGDTFDVKPPAVENIGNNVTISYNDMDFGSEGTESLEITWRSRQDKNSVRLDFTSEDGKTISSMMSFTANDEYKTIVIPLENPVKGKGIISFVFLPGCNIDLRSFKFIKE